MKKLKSPLLLILLMGIIGVTLALTFESPEFKIFYFNQRLDKEIVNAELKVTQSRETLLNQIQINLSELITEGQTYNETSNLTNHFAKFNEYYLELKEYVDIVIPSMNQSIELADFKYMETIIDSLSENDQHLARSMLGYQQQRVEYLGELNTRIESLVDLLGSFEVMFHTTDRPSQPIMFFQEVSYLFGEIERVHSQLVEVTQSYHLAKTNYYLILVNMGFREYFLGR